MLRLVAISEALVACSNFDEGVDASCGGSE